MTITMTLSDALNDYLQKTGESQRSLSLRSGLSQKCVSDIFAIPGLQPRKATLIALSRATGIDLCALSSERRQTYAALISDAERKGDKALCSRLRWLCRQAGWAAEMTPLCKQDIIDFFDAHKPARYGLSDSSYSTYRSTLIKAVGGGEARDRARRIDDIDGPYREIHQLIMASDLPMSARLLSGSFILYLHDMEIMPQEITSMTLGDYYRHRLDTSSKSEAKCERHVREIAALLRRLAARPDFVGFGFKSIEVPFHDRRDKFGVSLALLAPLLKEYDEKVAPWARGEQSRDGLSMAEIIARLDAEVPLDARKIRLRTLKGQSSETGEVRRSARQSVAQAGFLLGKDCWSPRTVQTRRGYVISLAKAIGASADIVPESIAELTDPEFLEAGAETLVASNRGEHPSDYVATILKSMHKIAAGYVAIPEKDLAEIADMIRHYSVGGRGIAPRNRAKLKQFKGDQIQATARLSDLIMTEINKSVDRRRRKHETVHGSLPRRIDMMDTEMIRDVMAALAHDIMLARAPRSANLLRARLDWVAWQGNEARIIVPAVEVKARQHGDADLTIPLSREVSTLLRTYLDKLRPRVLRPGGEGNPFIFPGQGCTDDGLHQPYKTLLQRTTRLLARHVGIKINPHLYRHLVGWIWLKDSPDHLPQVQRLLGHKSIQTTQDYYAEIDENLAIEAWQEHLSSKRSGCLADSKKRKMG
ncbi:site-specific integrase [Paracoccus actinidiae]|uniref:site-specific integrase n=1 Tax=Paracoccus actinidiae TaxID=3064531 RepID=UPI0027D24C2E|nr:site-specific integrase [Paracoccus sp. M09]